MFRVLRLWGLIEITPGTFLCSSLGTDVHPLGGGEMRWIGHNSTCLIDCRRCRWAAFSESPSHLDLWRMVSVLTKLHKLRVASANSLDRFCNRTVQVNDVRIRD